MDPCFHGAKIQKFARSQPRDFNNAADDDEPSIDDAGKRSERWPDGPGGSPDVGLPIFGTWPDIHQSHAMFDGAEESFHFDRTGAVRLLAARYSSFNRSDQHGCIPPHRTQPVGGGCGADLAVVSDHDASAEHGRPMVGGLYQRCTGCMDSSRYGGPSVFFGSLDVERVEGARGIPTPGQECCSVNPRYPVIAAG